jgi:hypothetical protein
MREDSGADQQELHLGLIIGDPKIKTGADEQRRLF